jgi:hypothetical protein
MQRTLLAVSKRAGEFDNAALAGGQKLLAGKFRRSPEVATLSCARWIDQIGGEGMKVSFVSGRDRQRGRVDLDEAMVCKKTAAWSRSMVMQKRRHDGVSGSSPAGSWRLRKSLANSARISMLRVIVESAPAFAAA